jgi:hypothetical protein
MSGIAPASGRTARATNRIEESLRRLEAIARLDAKTLSRSYAPGKWTGLELLAHLADSDHVYYYRFLKVIAEEGAPIVPFDQDRWVLELRGKERPAAVSIATILAARKGYVHYLATLPEAALGRSTLHPEQGMLTALDLAEMSGKHALHHLEQLEAIRDGKTWSPKPKT